jgi:hypothetical protein
VVPGSISTSKCHKVVQLKFNGSSSGRVALDYPSLGQVTRKTLTAGKVSGP